MKCNYYNYLIIANAVDQLSVEWNSDPLLNASRLVKLVYQNISAQSSIFTVSLPSSILMQGNNKVSLNKS